MIPFGSDSAVLHSFQAAVLVLVALVGTGVALVREPESQAVALSLYGLLLALMFFVFQAPDVALSQIVVGAVVLPLMILLSLARVRRDREASRGKVAGKKGDA